MENNPTVQSMTVRDVARLLNVDEKTVYRLAQRGGLPGFKVAGSWRFKRADLEEWIDRQKQVVAERAILYEVSPPSREHEDPSAEGRRTG